MKKVILALALVVTSALVSCKHEEKAKETTTAKTDSTVVAVDSVSVDTAAVATDSVK